MRWRAGLEPLGHFPLAQATQGARRCVAWRWASFLGGVAGALALLGLAFLMLAFEAMTRATRAAGDDGLGIWGILSLAVALGAALVLAAGIWSARRIAK